METRHMKSKKTDVTLEQMMGSMKTPSLNKLIKKLRYGSLTLRQLALIVMANRDVFPDGLDTKIMTCDAAMNNVYTKFWVSPSVVTKPKVQNVACLVYDTVDAMIRP
jgi:hypothetical protein